MSAYNVEFVASSVSNDGKQIARIQGKSQEDNPEPSLVGGRCNDYVGNSLWDEEIV